MPSTLVLRRKKILYGTYTQLGKVPVGENNSAMYIV